VNGELLVDVVELLADVLEDDAADVGAREGRIEEVGILVQRHHERLLLGVGDGRQQRQHQRAEDEAQRSANPAHRFLPCPSW
jgi:hypothetical protein